MARKIQEVLWVTAGRAKREFETLPLDQQFDIAVLETMMHPPHSGFDVRIARKGEAAIPFLMDRLDKEKDDQRRAHAVKILHLMSQDFPDLPRRQEIVDAIQRSIDEMSDGPWKQASEAMLREIRR